MSKALATLDNNEKSIGMELKKTVRQLEESRQEAVKSMAETISLAADAGDIILSARTEGLDVDGILEVAGLNGEEGRIGNEPLPRKPNQHRKTLPQPQHRPTIYQSGLICSPLRAYATDRARFAGATERAGQTNLQGKGIAGA